MNIFNNIIPFVIIGIILYGIIKKVNIMEEFAKGAKENLITAFEILPCLVLLMTAVGMFKASGTVDIIEKICSPVITFLGFPADCISLAIVRPISGSGALATLETILSSFSPDSYTGRVASVLMGSTETTFYTITVYFAALKKKAFPCVFISAAAADTAGFIFSALSVRFFFGY